MDRGLDSAPVCTGRLLLSFLVCTYTVSVTLTGNRKQLTGFKASDFSHARRSRLLDAL